MNKNTEKAHQKTDKPNYIFADNKIMVYRLKRYDKPTNTAHLTLYKNLTDFQTDRPLNQITVSEWQ